MTTETIERTDTATDAAAILEAVRAAAPVIAGRGDEIERGRRLPPDLVGDLRDAGCFRMLVPTRLGGAAAPLDVHLQLLRELARADGSVAWTVMIGSLAPAILGLLPSATFDGLYADGAD
ncbi:MAG: acyl-CoA dehydrogenase family protein, partial [Ilumatobacteraceae bacterium]